MNRRRMCWTASLALALLWAGCSSPPQPGRMKVANLSLGKQLDKTVAVRTAGGQPTSSAGMPQIGDKELAQAITESLQVNGLFRAVVSAGEADYVLTATIASFKPMMGFGATYIEIVWSLNRKGQAKPFWERLISGRGTSGAFAGSTRMRHAAEESVQDNIHRAFVELSQVQLPGGE